MGVRCCSLRAAPGIAPLMAMLRHRAIARDNNAKSRQGIADARLLYSSQSWDCVIYREELERMDRADATLRVTQTLTPRRPPGWPGLDRRIDAAMLREVAWPPTESPRIFICGPRASRFIPTSWGVSRNTSWGLTS